MGGVPAHPQRVAAVSCPGAPSPRSGSGVAEAEDADDHTPGSTPGAYTGSRSSPSAIARPDAYAAETGTVQRAADVGRVPAFGRAGS
jgi:hypothetical protein